jgi:hypothetical protein
MDDGWRDLEEPIVHVADEDRARAVSHFDGFAGGCHDRIVGLLHPGQRGVDVAHQQHERGVARILDAQVDFLGTDLLDLHRLDAGTDALDARPTGAALSPP